MVQFRSEQWFNINRNKWFSMYRNNHYRVNGSKTISKDEIKWGKSSVRNIIRNTVYCGFRIIKGNYKIITPAIITEDIFYKCQSEIKDRVTHTDKTLKNDFMLRGILRCGECGKYFIGTRSHGNLLYKCADKTHTKSNSYIGCNNGSIFQIHVEPMIWNTIKFSYVMMKNSQLMKENIVEINVKIENLTGELNSLGGAIAELNNESSRLVSLYVKGLFEESALDKEQRRIKADLDTLNRRQSVCHELRNSASMSLKSIEDLSLSKLNIQAVDESPILQKEAVRELISEVLMHKIDNLFTVFEIIYKAGYSNFIIRQTWTKKYEIVDGKIFVFNKRDKLFNYSGDDESKFRVDTLFTDIQKNY